MRRSLIGVLIVLTACSKEPPPSMGVPEWSKHAIWYQVFVERFRNGDPTNDPTPADMTGATDEPIPEGWTISPWGSDWYAQAGWEKQMGKDFYGTVYSRRYGGDLQGLLDKLDYLQQLGVTALYLNPINDAPSLHKFDARNYHHIDRNFGPDPRGDVERMSREDPNDPATWGWTAADSQFLALVKEVHRRHMRIILDYSWNHTGISFWAWRDVLEHQAKSKYAGWYEVERFDDPATPDTNEFKYRGWVGVPWLPEWKKVGRPAGKTHGAIEGNLVEGVRQHVFAVTRRWMDPDGDGNPEDGIDGFRLDVAEMVPLGFWRDYRQYVRSINPEAYLVGEIWWEQWPDRIYDAAPWANDSVFDAVMNYRWFEPTRDWFMGATTASQYVRALDSITWGISLPHQQAMMNLTASHDTPRFGTAIYNPGRYKYHNRPTEDSLYKIDRPDQRTHAIQTQILAQQFTWTGAPHIWNGDEVGMWGADDPDERKPLVWADLTYADETTHPTGQPRKRDAVRPDTALFATYRELAALRQAHSALLSLGTTRWLVQDDARRLLAYERALDSARIVVGFNGTDAPQELTVPVVGSYEVAWPRGLTGTSTADTLKISLPPRGAVIWKQR